MNMRPLALLTTSALLILLLAACNLPIAPPTPDPALVGTIAAQTLSALGTPPSAASPTPALTTTRTPTGTPTPTLTPTFEPPLARFTGDTNCRLGPGTGYEIRTVVRSGQKAPILGKAEQGNYWIIQNPNGEGACWVAGDYTEASGSLHLLPTMTAPPTPTPEPLKAPAWKDWSYTCAFAPGGSDVTISLAWTDTNRNESGYNIYRNEGQVATLGPDTTTFSEVAFVSAGLSLSYVIEVYNALGQQARSSAVTATCQ
jgi:hypothetical protein